MMIACATTETRRMVSRAEGESITAISPASLVYRLPLFFLNPGEQEQQAVICLKQKGRSLQCNANGVVSGIALTLFAVD